MKTQLLERNEVLLEMALYTAGMWITKLKDKDYIWERNQSLEDRIEQHNIQLLHSQSADRHFKLARLVSSPYLVTAIGDIWLLDHQLLWVVWPRKMSVYAQEVMRDFFEIAGDYQVVTISWGAVGVDSLCHKLSIDKDIPTIVVLGEWLRRGMLSTKRHLIQAVVEAWGLVLSEFPLDMAATKWSFPQRNRIVAGMSEALFVPAAGVRSGSLISVDFAIQMHVPVYTVPWSIYDATSAGTNAYLARVDITGLTQFEALFDKHFTSKNLTETSLLSTQSVSFTQSQESLLSRLPATKEALISQDNQWSVLGDLTMLEIQWVVRMNSRGEWMRK